MPSKSPPKKAAKAASKCPKGHELEDAKGMLHCRPCSFWQNAPAA